MVECTANGNAWGTRPNPLMNPECGCPTCQGRDTEQLAAVAAELAEKRQWLRASGRSARRQVELFDLGETGRHALGAD